jgi:hypothetical protein
LKNLKGTVPMPKTAANPSKGKVPSSKPLPGTSKTGGASMGTPGKKGI